jgi:hypothetical protein
VIVLAIGDTGVGKSCFLNRWLEEEAFEASDSPDPVTLAPETAERDMGSLRRVAIDTQGLADGQTIEAEQITQLATFLQAWMRGVHAVVIVLNGQFDRFSQGVQDTLAFAYNAFGNREILSNICIAFSKCYAVLPYSPNRDRKRTEYRQRVQDHLRRISGVDSAPEIPVFFGDWLEVGGDPNSETNRTMVQFLGWASSRTPVSTQSFSSSVRLGETVSQEEQMRVPQGHSVRGDCRYAQFVDRVREVITPNNGNPVRYGEWNVIRQYEELDGRRTVRIMRKVHRQRRREVDRHGAHSMFGFSSRDHTHWTIVERAWDEVWDEETDFDGVTTKVRHRTENDRTLSVYSGEERGWTDGYVQEWVE